VGCRANITRNVRRKSAATASSYARCKSVEISAAIGHVLALDIAGLVQALMECGEEVLRECIGRVAVEKSNHRHRRLLPSRALHLGRKQQAAATEQCDELTPLHVRHGGLPPLRAISAAD